jgi:CYTH domain-containing protein
MSETLNKGKTETLDDNARKFTVGRIDLAFLEGKDTTSYNLVIDWIKVGNGVEEKVVRKEFSSGEVQILKVSKPTGTGNRQTEKTPITEEEYKKLLPSSIHHIEKKRYEFKVVQKGLVYKVKYDEFKGSKFCMLEVDAADGGDRKAFDPTQFTGGTLKEVTGNSQYYGYQMAETLKSATS